MPLTRLSPEFPLYRKGLDALRAALSFDLCLGKVFLWLDSLSLQAGLPDAANAPNPLPS